MSTPTLSAANTVSSAKTAAQQAQIDPTVLLHELQQQVGALQKQVDALKTQLAAMQPQVEMLIGHSHEVTIPTWGGLTFLNVKEYVLSQNGPNLDDSLVAFRTPMSPHTSAGYVGPPVTPATD
jgi:hypothetical protein